MTASKTTWPDVLVRCLMIAASVLCLHASMPATAQAQDSDNVVSSGSEQTSIIDDDTYVAPVIVEGEILFRVRGFTALPADERAEGIANRIIDLAEASDEPSVDLLIRPHRYGRSVSSDGLDVVLVSGAEAKLEGLDVEALAEIYANRIREAVVAYRAKRTQSARLSSAKSALAWTAGFVIVSMLFFRRRNAFIRAVGRLVESRFEDVEQATKSIVRGQAVAGLVRFAMQLVLWAVYFVIFYYYLSLVLFSIAETRPLAQLLLTYVTTPLIDILKGFVSYLPSLITLIIIAFITRYLIQGVKVVLDNVEAGVLELGDFERHWVAPTYFLSRILIIGIAIVFAYPHIPGSDSAAFQGLTIIAGVMVSLGSNTVVSNIMAGLFVIYRRSTNIGDRIRVGDLTGDVIEIKLMETILKSLKNELISIPNAKLLNSEVVNYTRAIDGRGLMVHTVVGIGYEEPPKKIEAMLIEAAGRTAGLKKAPKPFVLWSQLADYAINYEINAFTSRGGHLPKIMSDLHSNIVDVFNENGTQIMTPSYEADPEIPKIPSEDWDGTLAHQLGVEQK
ncbi:mechanosensitive ion channel family protein [Roseovarius sp. EL26]|uniref:mechanosensitive ion channel family protein n=1 Tax=Roseovarius sp. EL26 TaxID=2126672 RepID=UPI0020B14838|nr:mechanosensitive ion channel family protein [Roseovarius sp. EL26]